MELRFGLDYNFSKDLLNSPGKPPSTSGTGKLLLEIFLQYRSRRKDRVGCFTQVTKINAVLLLGAPKRRKAWTIALLFREMDFAQKESAQGKIQEEGGKVMLQASFLTSSVGLKIHNKV